MLKDFTPQKPSENARKAVKELQTELAVLQQEIKAKNLPVVILIDGWSAAGKGSIISRLTARMEPRSYKVFSAKEARGDDARKPYLYRFFRDIPAKGNVAIFERGWYYDAFEQMQEHEDYDDFFADTINTFERQLVDDGYIVLKYFLHLSKKTQKERMEELTDRKATTWRVDESDILQNRRYDATSEVIDRLLDSTSTDHAPWKVIWNEDKHDGMFCLLQNACKHIRRALDGEPRTSKKSKKRVEVSKLSMPKLSDIDMSDCILTEAEYKKQLKKEQAALSHLHSLLYREKVPVVIAFEGWDAAGKGGAIRRLSWSLDPRGFEAISVAAPTSDELAHHYLWRFWNKMPKDGHITIFDRTWYGRVMVERIEGYTKAERWSMAFDEINEFEKELTNHGAIVLKFFIHIDKDTQLARFTERQNTPEKQYKITDEDWRNRERWDEYESAIDEMIEKTSTKKAPWIIVEGNDKLYARIKVLKQVRKALQNKLE